MTTRRGSAGWIAALAGILLATPAARAQPLGTFHWQLQPYCNVLTLSVQRAGGVYTLDGYDDQCGAAERASVVGTAFLNPDGSVGMGLSSMTAPEAAPVVLHARIELATVSGTWRDSAGNSGAIVFTAGASAGGVLRPVPANGIRPGSVTATQLAPGSVGAEQIAAGAVEASRLAPDAIATALGPLSSGQIAAGAITAAHIAPDAVGAGHIAAHAVGLSQIAPGAVQAVHLAPGVASAAIGPITSGQIAPGAILSAHIVPGAVTAAHIAPGAVGAAQIAPGAVGPSQLAAGAVGGAHIAEGAIGASHLAPGIVQSLVVGTCAVGQYLRGVTAAGRVICEPFFAPTVSTSLNDLDLDANVWTSMAVGPDGLPVIASYDNNAAALRVTKCRNPACTGGSLTTLTDGPVTGIFPFVAIGADGLPLIAHEDGTVGGLRVTRCGNPGCTFGNVSTLVDSGGGHPSIAIGADGLPVISHSTGTTIRVTKCGNGACAEGNVSTTVSDPLINDGHEPSIAIGADGFPVISHGAVVGGDRVLRVTKCGDAACTAGNVTTTVDDARPLSVGEESSIAIGGDGLPIISHREIRRSNLRVTKCSNAACTAGNITTTVDDPVEAVGNYLSMAVGVDGLPVIAYQALPSGAVHVIKCGNQACTSGNVITAVDNAAPLLGFWNLIAIGGDGVPVIAHVDQVGVIRVTKCGTQSCR